jgi:hypothetical protein
MENSFISNENVHLKIYHILKMFQIFWINSKKPMNTGKNPGKRAKKNLRTYVRRFLRIWQRHTFPGITQVSSALMGLTTLFGKGRGGHHR